MRGFLLGLSLSVAFILGCVTSQLSHTLVIPPAQAGEQHTKWSYMCGEFEKVERLHEVANKAGLEGWELVGGSGMGRAPALGQPGERHIWCFKRPLP